MSSASRSTMVLLVEMRSGVTDLARTVLPRATERTCQPWDRLLIEILKLTVVAEEDGRGRDALLLGYLDDGLRGHDGAASAAEGAVGLNVDALLLAEVDNLLLGKARVVLDLVDSGDDGGMRQKLLEVSLAVLWWDVSLELYEIEGGKGLTLQTPTPLVLPVATSFSICFQPSTWL